MNPQRRITEEKILQHFFPDSFVFHEGRPCSLLDIGMKTQSNTAYHLRIIIPRNYPNSCPELWVAYPKPLRAFDGKILDGPSHEMHTLGLGDHGLQICHYEHGEWTANHTLYRVVFKGRAWLECYEAHLRIGESIDKLSGGRR